MVTNDTHSHLAFFSESLKPGIQLKAILSCCYVAGVGYGHSFVISNQMRLGKLQICKNAGLSCTNQKKNQQKSTSANIISIK